MISASQTAIWIVREQARPLAGRLGAVLGAAVLPEQLGSSNKALFRETFSQFQRWILVMTTGIAVRYLSGLPDDKKTDPAVVVLDEAARFAISLLSGHEGGANQLAYEVARITGATPVITTATETLKPLTIGLGARKGIAMEDVDAAVRNALEGSGYTVSQIREAATIDLKAQEAGLVEWCAKQEIPLRIFSRDLLSARPWFNAPSEWVKQNTGVEAVCEPCALLANPNGVLLVPKTARNGVTVSIVRDLSIS